MTGERVPEGATAAILEAAPDAYALKGTLFADDDDFSPCPCFSIHRPDFRARGRCWRVSCADGKHPDRDADGAGCCVHVWGDPAAAARLKVLLDEADWYGAWSLTVEGPTSGTSPTLPKEAAR